MGEVDAVVEEVMEEEEAVEVARVVTTVLTLWVAGDREVGGPESFLVVSSSLATSFTFAFFSLEPSPGPLGMSLFLEALFLVEGGRSLFRGGLADGFFVFFTFLARDVCSSLSNFYLSWLCFICDIDWLIFLSPKVLI